MLTIFYVSKIIQKNRNCYHFSNTYIVDTLIIICKQTPKWSFFFWSFSSFIIGFQNDIKREHPVMYFHFLCEKLCLQNHLLFLKPQYSFENTVSIKQNINVISFFAGSKKIHFSSFSCALGSVLCIYFVRNVVLLSFPSIK